VGWRDLLPTRKCYGLPEKVRTYYQIADVSSDLEVEFQELFQRTYYLGPLREYPHRQYTWSGGTLRDVGRSGERVVEALLASRTRGTCNSPGRRKKHIAVETHVADWLRQLGLIHDFMIDTIDARARLYRVVIQITPSSEPVLLTDVGFGVSQVPVGRYQRLAGGVPRRSVRGTRGNARGGYAQATGSRIVRTVVIDTNVLAAANGEATHANEACLLACVASLREVKRRGRVVIDAHGEILAQYWRHCSYRGGPGVGDEFFLWLHENQAVAKCCEAVRLRRRGKNPDADFEAFPDDPAFAGFDNDDRVFVAAAGASAARPPILNATDRRWSDHLHALARHDVAVEIVCPELWG
jgi:hypothetical protein